MHKPNILTISVNIYTEKPPKLKPVDAKEMIQQQDTQVSVLIITDTYVIVQTWRHGAKTNMWGC